MMFEIEWTASGKNTYKLVSLGFGKHALIDIKALIVCSHRQIEKTDDESLREYFGQVKGIVRVTRNGKQFYPATKEIRVKVAVMPAEFGYEVKGCFRDLPILCIKQARALFKWDLDKHLGEFIITEDECGAFELRGNVVYVNGQQIDIFHALRDSLVDAGVEQYKKYSVILEASR